MTQAEWIEAANKLLKSNPDLTYQQAEQQLADDGFKRPTGITQKGSSKSGKRFGVKAKRTKGQDIRRAEQEKVSTEQAAEYNKQLAEQRKEIQGIAEHAQLPEPHREHVYSQDISGEITEGAPSDYIQNVPSDIAAVKTALEQRIRTRYNNRYVVGLGVDGLRVIPKKFWDERVNPDDLPGIDIDETHSLEDQLGVLKSIEAMAPPEPLGGYVSPGLGPGDPFKIFTTAHRPEPVETGTPGTALTLPSLPNTTGPQMPDFKPQTIFNWENKPVSKKEPEPDLTLQLDPNKAASASFTGQGLPYFLEAVRDVGRLGRAVADVYSAVSEF